MTELNSRASSAAFPGEAQPASGKFAWGRAARWILVAGILIGTWLAALVSIALDQITRGGFVPFHPSNTYVVVSTFLMLIGVVLLSIQLVAVISHAFHRDGSTGH